MLILAAYWTSILVCLHWYWMWRFKVFFPFVILDVHFLCFNTQSLYTFTRTHIWTYIHTNRLAHTQRKMAKMWILSGQLPLWLATGAGHGPDGSAPHQYRWADVVWAPCCRDCVMVCCGVLVVFHWPLVARGSHILHLGLGVLRARLLGLCCTDAFPLIFLQLRKGPL